MHETEGRHLFRDMIADSDLDADEIMKALDDSITLGLVQWGASRDIITKILLNPTYEDMHRLITNAHTLLQPLEDWLVMERNLNDLRKPMISKTEYYHAEYRTSQIQNFILILKLY